MKQRHRSILWVALIVCSLAAQTCYGQIFGDSKKLDAEFVPSDAFAAGLIFPREMMDDEKFELVPHEIITAWGQQEFGFDPMKIEQATFVVKGMESMNEGPPQWAAVLRFEEMQGLSDKLIGNLKEKKLGDKTLYSSQGRGPSFLVYDDSTMIIGEEAYMGSLLDADGKGGLAKIIKSSKLPGQGFGFVDFTQIRDAVNEQIDMMGSTGMPPQIERMKEIPDLLDAIEFAVNVDSTLETHLILHARSDDAAEQIQEITADALAIGKQILMAQMAQNMDSGDPIGEATIRYVKRITDSYEKKLTPEIDGKQLKIAMANEAAMAPVLIGMLLPAVQQVREAARRTDSANRLRQMTLAMHNYYDVHKGFPGQANYDENGKPLLSWRVHILPYIEQQELYEKFRLDEPWDSPHNRELIKEMPEFFQNPNVVYEEGKTVYLGVAGDGYAFGKDTLTFDQIRDGTSNTVFMVEADSDQAVIWSKPVDYEVDPENPMRGLGGLRPAGFNATFMDGSVHFISNATDREMWHSMLTIDGGEVINN